VELFDAMRSGDHEQVVWCQDRSSGLRAIVAIHSTRLGPGLGGTRFRPYPDETAALDDVLRLSRAMTYKAAAAGLPLGGGKAVIIGDPATDRTEALMRAYGRFLDGLGGRYVTAEDVGTTTADMDLLAEETPFVTGTTEGKGGSGDPSPATAVGVLHAMRGVAERLWGTAELGGRRVVVDGVGKVGSALVRDLVAAGAEVVVADIAPAAVDRMTAELGVEAVDAERAHAVDCDIFSPCALGGILNPTTIPQLRCAAVAGAANNQLADPTCADRLRAAGILYAPDYVVNAGGIINIAEELAPAGYDHARAYANLARVRDTVLAVIAAAEREGVTTAVAADRLAESRLAGAPAGPRRFPRPSSAP
jgi:glutamate dehydrogenase/leucine dehydrogenase